MIFEFNEKLEYTEFIKVVNFIYILCERGKLAKSFKLEGAY